MPVAGIDSGVASQRRFRVHEYHRMIAAGILDEDEQIELLCGTLVTMSPQGTRHARAVEQLSWLLARALDDAYRLRVQLPLTIGDDDEPEPDLAIVRAEASRRAGLLDRHPETAVAVIEVAEQSLRKDRELKAPLYARAGVPTYCIVNLPDALVEVYRDPTPSGYARVETVQRGAALSLGPTLDIALSLSDILA
ncbi:Uma2 family endonuclease [Haliangium sp.]|uniref:Uma2 family endonuclease n=1 Tax=Haliangium sp. TaxID=2663208 RepID=UPI003D113CC0